MSAEQPNPMPTNIRSIEQSMLHVIIQSRIALMITDIKIPVCLGKQTGTSRYTLRGFFKKCYGTVTEQLRAYAQNS